MFQTHPELAAVVRKLRRLGAKPAMMTGSGSAVFGLFEKEARVWQAAAAVRTGNINWVRFVKRRQYRQLWRRALGTAAQASCFAS